MLKAINIKWDLDVENMEAKVELSLPREIIVPEDMTDEDEISDYISEFTGFCHKGFELKRELDQKYVDILEENDWSISSYIDDGRVELQKYSPAGEDFYIVVEVENFPEAVREYAINFDADDHAEMWIEARGKVSGVPDSIRALIEDAEEIQEMLNELADALEGKGEYQDANYLANRICDCLSDGYNDEEYREETETELYNELSQLSSNSFVKAALIKLCARIEEMVM